MTTKDAALDALADLLGDRLNRSPSDRALHGRSEGHFQDMPPDAPRSPCPQGRQAPVVRGRIFKFKSSLDPVSRPGWVPVARITYTQANVVSQNPPEPPEQVDFVFEEGGEYQIVVMRAGTVAVYATLGDFHPDTQTFIPRRMGIHRSVPVAR